MLFVASNAGYNFIPKNSASSGPWRDEPRTAIAMLSADLSLRNTAHANMRGVMRPPYPPAMAAMLADALNTAVMVV